VCAFVLRRDYTVAEAGELKEMEEGGEPRKKAKEMWLTCVLRCAHAQTRAHKLQSTTEKRCGFPSLCSVFTF
jgi:hypothetical protein